jgi:hypothetical protein
MIVLNVAAFGSGFIGAERERISLGLRKLFRKIVRDARSFDIVLCFCSTNLPPATATDIIRFPKV